MLIMEIVVGDRDYIISMALYSVEFQWMAVALFLYSLSISLFLIGAISNSLHLKLPFRQEDS